MTFSKSSISFSRMDSDGRGHPFSGRTVCFLCLVNRGQSVNRFFVNMPICTLSGEGGKGVTPSHICMSHIQWESQTTLGCSWVSCSWLSDWLTFTSVEPKDTVPAALPVSPGSFHRDFTTFPNPTPTPSCLWLAPGK